MYCKKCGKELDDSFKVCPYCGEPVNDEPIREDNNYQTYDNNYYNPTPANNDTGAFGWGLLSFIIPIVGIILYFVWKNEKPKTAKACLTCGLISFGLNIISMLMIL